MSTPSENTEPSPFRTIVDLVELLGVILWGLAPYIAAIILIAVSA